jgi:hypothetical protein
VEIEVTGANEVCSWTSTTLSKDCSTIGIAENSTQKLSLFPNPSEGRFYVSLPPDLTGSLALEVRDLTGRLVASERLPQGTGHEAVLELGHLPNGAYFVVLHANSQRYVGRVQVAD